MNLSFKIIDFELTKKDFLWDYGSKVLSLDSNLGSEGLDAFESITFPDGSIRINLGIEFILKALIKSEDQLLSANN